VKILDEIPQKEFDIIIVGSGFAGSFFLDKLLKLGSNLEILVVERGSYIKHWDRVKNRTITYENSSDYYVNRNPKIKEWGFTLGFGGGSNCWTGNTPRLLPDDFKVKSLYDFGVDWPLEYEELEPYYSEVESIMEIAGSQTPYTMSRAYPLMPHRMSPVDLILKERHPEDFFALPSARATSGGSRAMCCSNGRCSLCPIDAKFTIENGCRYAYKHFNVSIIFDTEVRSLQIENDCVKGINVTRSGRDAKIKGKWVVMAANGLFNPYLLLQSNLEDGIVGRGITEQTGYIIDIQLKDIYNFQGGSIGTGWYTKGLKRNKATKDAAFMFHTENITESLNFNMDNPLGHLRVVMSIEDFRVDTNRVVVNAKEGKPEVYFKEASIHTQQTELKIKQHLSEFLEGFSYHIMNIEKRKTEWHIQCSTPMGKDPDTSVTDKYGFHHRVKHLIVLGSGNFPTAPPSNPSLTISALARFSAEQFFKIEKGDGFK
jgi:choline dehydrogenase-like flavoprotein